MHSFSAFHHYVCGYDGEREAGVSLHDDEEVVALHFILDKEEVHQEHNFSLYLIQM